MRLIPHSLFGRLILVLLGGLVVAQFVTAAFMLRDRGQTLYQLFREDVVLRTVNIVRLLDSVPRNERQRLVRVLGGPTTRIALIDEAELESSASAASVLLREQLRRMLPEVNRVEVSTADQFPLPMMNPGGAHERAMHEMPMHRPWSFMHGGMVSAGAFRIQVRLADGTWVQLHRAVPKELLDWPTRILWTLIIMLISVLALSFVAVRWITRPLRMLADAASELGRDIQRPPLATDGPIEVANAASAFNTMQQRLGRFIGDRSRILAAVSHDLKTPITRLRLRSEMLEDKALRTKFQKDLDDMERMVSETRDVMRGTEVEEQSRPIDVVALIESLQDDAHDAGWRVEIHAAQARPYVGKPVALRRCLTNLIENAVRYGKRADIKIRDGVQELCFVISDDGSGVPEAELERLFDPFYRLEASRSQHTGGSGLGLSIARNIARAHGGDVTLKNREYGGLEATLALPR
jgi:signal transduction histidine kinase